MEWMETILAGLLGSGALVLLVRAAAAYLKGTKLAKNLQVESLIDAAAEFGVLAIENLARDRGIRGGEKHLGAVELAQERLARSGVEAGASQVGLSVSAAYERLKSELHAGK